MPATMRVYAMRKNEFTVRERATADRLGRFRGDMSDGDFALLVADVLRLKDKAEGRAGAAWVPFKDTANVKPETL